MLTENAYTGVGHNIHTRQTRANKLLAQHTHNRGMGIFGLVL